MLFSSLVEGFLLNNRLSNLSENTTVITGNALGCLFRRLSEQVGFKVYAHKFRHTFATNLAIEVPNAFLVAQALGLTDLNTALIYVHLAQSELATISQMGAHLKRK